MYIKRNLESTILAYLSAPEIIAVVGPRQSGKTTLIKELLKNLTGAVSVSFDDQNILSLFERNTDDFIGAYVKGNKYLFIDEFQYAKNGGKILKRIYDSERIKIIISGSSAADLTIQAVKYLVGRVLVFNLYPFDFGEFLKARDNNFFKVYLDYKAKIDFSDSEPVAVSQTVHEKFSAYYEEFLLFGGYPRVVLEENYESKKELLRNIYNTYFLREVRDLLGLADDFKLNDLLQALALQIGGLIQYEELSRLSHYSYPTLRKYLNFLGKTYICKLTRPYYKNKRAEIVKNPKVYFFDTGLRNVVVDDFRKLSGRPDKGALLENGLAAQFIKEGKDFNFWRDKKKNEIDFVLSLSADKKIAVESKCRLKDNFSQSLAVFKRYHPGVEVFYSYLSADEISRVNAYPIYLF